MLLLELLLADKAAQIESLTIHIPAFFLLDSRTNSQTGYQWPILSSLHISSGGDGTPQIFDSCPQLTELRLGPTAFWGSSIGTLSWMPWKTLLHVDLACLSSDDLMRVFRLAPNLETLHSEGVVDDAVDPFADDIWEVDEYLTGSDTPPPELMVTHRNLKHWSFSQKDEEYLFQAFQNMQLLRLPALKSLKMEWGSTWEDGYPYNRLAQATGGWGCELEELDVWLGGFEEESLMEWLATEQFVSLRRLRLHWEHHDESLSSDLLKAMTATPEDKPIFPNLESLFIGDTPLNISADDVINMLTSRWDEGVNFPLQSCIVSVRSPNSDWKVEDHKANIALWRSQGYKVELETSGWVGEEDKA